MSRGRPLLRSVAFDDLGLRAARSDRLLPLLVGAMAFLAALAIGGAAAASVIAGHWQTGAGSVLTIQVPDPTEQAASGGGHRADRVLVEVRATAGVAEARLLGRAELDELLRPWLQSVGATTSNHGSDRGQPIAVPLPAVLDVRLSGMPIDLANLATRVQSIAPGTLVEDHAVWLDRLTTLARSLQACAGLALVVVACVAVAVVAVATRAGLLARRDSIEIVHGLGATDGYIAGRFARRMVWLASAGGTTGAMVALPVLIGLARLAAPFSASGTDDTQIGAASAALPLAIWVGLPVIPMASAAIGWLTAQSTVRTWLRRLP